MYARQIVSKATIILCIALTLTLPPAWAASGPPTGVTFTDIAAGDGAGISYRRERSPSDALFDVIKQQPLYTFNDLLVTPLKSRGVPGVAVFDYDDDGDQDVYVTNGPGASNSLYSNQLVETGQVSFVDVGDVSGTAAIDQDSTGVCYGDTDNDGDQDLLVLGNSQPDRFFENQGEGTFLDVTVGSGLGNDSLTSVSCSMGDVDGDGLLDIAVANATPLETQFAIFVEPFAFNQHNQLFINQGAHQFTDVSAASGIQDLFFPQPVPPGAATITWAISLVDLDLDGDLDLIQGDDQAGFPMTFQGGLDRGFIQIFDNDGSGQFTNVTMERGTGAVGFWMGLSFGDFNRDGRLDFFGANFGNRPGAVIQGPAFLDVMTADSRWFLQNADGTFSDSADAGYTHSPFGWGTSAADYDNDGDTDIIYHGGLDLGPFVSTNPGVIFNNDGTANFSRDAAALAGSTDHQRRTVHGMAVGDFDNNGFTDIVSVSNFDFPEPTPLVPAPPLGGEFQADATYLGTFLPIDLANFIFTWSGIELEDGTLSVELSSADNGARYVQVETLGTVGLTTGGAVNRDGIGAVVEVRPHGGAAVLLPVLGGSSHASQDSLVQSAGLGDAQQATVEILWPGGVRNRLHNVNHGTRVVFPEIPCSYDDPVASFGEYQACVTTALDELEAAGVLDTAARAHFLGSALLAYQEAH